MPRLWLSLLSLISSQSVPMNDVTYNIANPAPHTPAQKYFRGEYFEFYGPPTTTQYSEVYWQPQAIPLPSEIVSRFAGRVMGVTGYEVDIVRTELAPNGTIISEKPVLPYEIYNHHFTGFMYGKNAIVQPRPPTSSQHHARPSFLVDSQEAAGEPTIQVFSEGNGNEHRASFHGYPNGFSQRIFSPAVWQNDIMIINTNKRLTDDKSPGPIGGPLPRTSLAPPNATYSGLLECPCTTRKTKILASYKILQHDGCEAGTGVSTATECESAVRVMGLEPTKPAGSVESKALPPGCSASFDWAEGMWLPLFNNYSSVTACGAPAMLSGTARSGSTTIASANVELSLLINTTSALVSLTGPADAWFAVGFNASKMADLPYAIVVDGFGTVTERKLGEHAAGTLLPVTVKVVTNTVTNNTRTVVVSRPITPDFPFYSSPLPIIAAGGASGVTNISYHAALKGSAAVTLTQDGTTGVCLCRDPQANTGSIDGQQFQPAVCAPFPTSELLTKHNAICNITEYDGGLYCCHGGTFLLDADQVIPPATDTWRMKYRFYFEDATVVPSKNSFRLWWSTEAYNNEYDVPKSTAACEDARTDPEDCVYTIKSVFKGSDLLGLQNGCMVPNDLNACGNVTRIREQDGGLFQLIYAAGHCHAPACVSMELWDTDKQELICANTPTYGTGDLAGYFSGIPPCLWGSASEGLLSPPILSLDSNLTTIKRTNSTNGHWGVMGLWQMRGAYVS